MTPDREQTRQMVDRDRDSRDPAKRQAAAIIDALLSELKQAERERDEWKAYCEHEQVKVVQAERERDEARERIRQADRLSADLLEELQKHGLRL